MLNEYNVATLHQALDTWDARDIGTAQPAVRQAANTVIDSIDQMLVELHALRSRTVSEIRQHDDLAARADALLAQLTDPAPVIDRG